MRVPFSKLGSVLAGGYLVLVAVAVVWAGVLAQTNSAESGGPGLATFFLTFPWSLLAAVALGAVNARLLESYSGVLAVLVASAVINAAILYLVGAVLGRVFSGTRGRT
jgi:hypothetical protein